MSFLEAVLQRTKRLERLLEEKYQAVGKGLHEKTTSVEHQLDAATVKKLRFIASVRNRLMHEDDYSYERSEESRFLETCDEVINYLQNYQPAAQAAENDWFIPRPGTASDFAAPPYDSGKSENSSFNRYEAYSGKPKIGKFKKLLMILGGLWLFGFLFTVVINIVFFFVRQSQSRNQQENVNKPQLVQVNSKILDSYVGQYNCRSYKIEVSRIGDSLKTSSSVATGVLTAVSDSEFAASGYSNGFDGRMKFAKNQKGKIAGLIILNTNGIQEQCNKVK